jgi:hypothetical protein
MSRFTIVIVVALCVPSSAILAQQPPPVEVGQQVRVHAQEVVEGVVIAVSPETLTVEVRGVAQRIPLTSVRMLQVIPSDAESVLVSVRPGNSVRYHSRTHGRGEGQLLGVREGRVLLSGGFEHPAGSVDSLWTRGRATKKGAVVGGIAGSVLGGAGFAFLSGFCDYDCSSAAEAAIGGIVLGGLSGALFGGVLGAAIGKWTLRFPTDGWQQVPLRGYHPAEPTLGATAVAPITDRGIGTASASPGLAYIANTGPAVGGSASLLADLGALSLGPEVGYYGAGNGQSVWNAGGAFRVLLPRAALQPYGVMDISYYSWNTSTTSNGFGIGLGGGLLFRRPERRWFFGAEARFHSNVQRLDTDTGGTSFVSLQMSGTITW